MTAFVLCLSVAAGAGIMLGVVWIVASVCFASRWLSEADRALVGPSTYEGGE